MNEERRREQQRTERARGGEEEGEAHFLLRTQGRKFMNGSHLSSCSKCKQHTWTKKHERSAQAMRFNGGLLVLLTHTHKKQSSDMFKLF